MFSYLKQLNVGSRLKNIASKSNPLSTSTNSSGLGFQFKSPSHQTVHLLLGQCSTMKELKQIHAQIIAQGLTEENQTIGKLMSFCAVNETGDLQYAQFLFDRVINPNRFMYNSLMRGYAGSIDPSRALPLYRNMIMSGISPNEFTLPFVLKSCACKFDYSNGMIVHGHSIKLGIGLVVVIQNAIIYMYVACGLVYDARKVFDEIAERTLVSWNSMIWGYAKTGCYTEAFLVFLEMRQAGTEPDKFTFMSLLSISSQTCDLKLGRCIHFYVEISGESNDFCLQNAIVDMYAKCGDLHTAQTFFDRMLDKNVVSWTSLFSAYARNGFIEYAREIFEHMPEKNVVSWNSMIACYVQESRYGEALLLFGDMCRSKVIPDEASLVITLTACSQLGDLIMGEQIHDYICNSCMKHNAPVLNALIDMFAKCGALQIAQQIFLEMVEKNVVSYNVMIGAFALHGYGIEAVNVFENMQAEGIRPDNITFTALLSACTHSRLVEVGTYYFDRMVTFYGVPHEIEHYACMIDLLGRGGLLEEAIKMMQKMEMKPDVVIWGALLGACRVHDSLEIGKIILKQLLELGEYNGGSYVLLSNIYCEARRWEDVRKLRKLMKNHGIEKGDAISSIEIDGLVHDFMVNDKKDSISTGIYAVLDQLMGHLKLVQDFYTFPEY